MGFVPKEGKLTAGDFTSNIVCHCHRNLVILYSVPHLNRDADIFQGKTPWKGEKMSIPGQSKQTGAECLDLRTEAGIPNFRLIELCII